MNDAKYLNFIFCDQNTCSQKMYDEFKKNVKKYTQIKPSSSLLNRYLLFSNESGAEILEYPNSVELLNGYAHTESDFVNLIEFLIDRFHKNIIISVDEEIDTLKRMEFVPSMSSSSSPNGTRLDREYTFLIRPICTISATIDNKSLLQMRSLLNENVEYGGTLDFIDNNVLGIKTQVRGQEISVQVPPHVFTWHTHPYKMMRKYSLDWGWPSCIDVVLALDENYELFILASAEGIYYMKSLLTSKEFIKSLTPRDRDVLKELVYQYFENQEYGRILNFQTIPNREVKVDTIASNPFEFVQIFNTITFKDIINWAIGLTFNTHIGILILNLVNNYTFDSVPIFKLDYTPWEQIENGYRLTLQYNSQKYDCK